MDIIHLKFNYRKIKNISNKKRKRKIISQLTSKLSFKDCIIVLLLTSNIIFFILYINSLHNKNNNYLNKNLNITDSDIEKKLSLSKEIIKVYSNLFETMRYYKVSFKNDNNIKVNNFVNKKGVGICTIGRNENLYAKEFVEYYLKLGIKKIIIYDNNDINEEKFEEVLDKYIKNNYVEIINIRGFQSVQLPLYNLCYKNYGDQFDYIAFLDFDEYITIKDNSNINDYIYREKFSKCESIILNWEVYGDNGLEQYDPRPLKERFTQMSKKMNQGKNIVLTGIPNLIIISTLIIGINTNYFCDSNGNRLYINDIYSFNPPDNPEAVINHYYTKTVDEFCNKLRKGDGHFYKNHPQYLIILNNRINKFIDINVLTYNKFKKLENCSGINLNKYKIRIK